MSARVYILIDVADGKAKDEAKVLRGKSGITLVDCVEEPPDIVMLVEAEVERP